MGIQRETVAAWECGQKLLSHQHDYILCGPHFGSHQPAGAASFPQDIRERAIGKVHARAETPTPPEPLIIAAELERLRDVAVHPQAGRLPGKVAAVLCRALVCGPAKDCPRPD